MRASKIRPPLPPVSLRSIGLLLLLLSHSAVRAEPQAPRLELWSIPTPSPLRPVETADRAVFEAFVLEHPDIKIVQTNGLKLQGERQESAFLMSIAAETAPYAFTMYTRTVLNFAQEGFLLPIDEWLARNEEPLIAVPKALGETVRLNGNTYGMIYSYHALCLHYRRDLFLEAGLDPDKPPRTWEELYEFALKLTNPAKGQAGIYLCNGLFAGQVFTNFVWQAGGEMVEQTPDGKWKAAFDSPQAVEAARFYQKLQRACVTLLGPDHGAIDLCRGRVAMTILTSGSPELVYELLDQGVSPAEIGIAPLPAGPAGRANMMVAAIMGVNSQIKSEADRHAALTYAGFWSSEKAEAIRAHSLVAQGFGMLVPPPVLKKLGYEDILAGLPASWISNYDQIEAVARPQPSAPGYDKIQNTRLPQVLFRLLDDPNADAEKLLRAEAETVNARVFNSRSDAELSRLRLLIGPIVLAIFGVFLLFLWRMFKMMSMDRPRLQQNTVWSEKRRRIYLLAAMFIMPALLLSLTWAYRPLLQGMNMALYDYKLAGHSTFVGLDNFINVLLQEEFWAALYRTLIYVALNLGLGFLAPVALAILLNEIPAFRRTFHVLWYLPAVTGGLVVMFLWKQIIYDPSPFGALNKLIAVVGLPPQHWLNDPKLAMICIVFVGIWSSVGAGSVLYLAALKTIPDEVYEAADIDGAGIFGKIAKVTLPMLSTLLLINFVGAFIGSFQAMGDVLVMTGGGPGNATTLLGLEIFYSAFLYLKFGHATAMAWVMGSMLIGFTVFQLKILRDVRFQSSKEAV